MNSIQYYEGKGLKVTSGYGDRQYTLNGKLVKDFHHGIDFGGAGKTGTPIPTQYAGVVRTVGFFGTAGNTVILDIGDEVLHFYHLDKILVKKGEKVPADGNIGTLGASGVRPDGKPSVTGPHLHFEIRADKGTSFGSARPAINPTNFTKAAPKEMSKDARHAVARGENLTVIGKKYGLTVAELVDLNKHTYPSLVKNPNLIQVGWKLVVTPSSDAIMVHKVVRGDSMWKISQKYGVTLDALVEANPQVEHPDHIEPGWEITIP